MQKNNRKLTKNKNKNKTKVIKIKNYRKNILGKMMFYSIRIIKIFSKSIMQIKKFYLSRKFNEKVHLFIITMLKINNRLKFEVYIKSKFNLNFTKSKNLNSELYKI